MVSKPHESVREREALVPRGTFARASSPATVSQPVAAQVSSPAVSQPQPVAPRCTFPVDEGLAASWEREDSDVYRLTLPSDAPGEVFPSIEAALLAAADQLHRAPSSPELPKVSEPTRTK